jgi:hypothetical protein
MCIALGLPFNHKNKNKPDLSSCLKMVRLPMGVKPKSTTISKLLGQSSTMSWNLKSLKNLTLSQSRCCHLSKRFVKLNTTVKTED